MTNRILSVLGLLILGSMSPAADPPAKAIPARSPTEERSTFKLPKGLAASLVAAEPDVIDPVAMAFDAKGRIYVCEMRGYPNGGVGTGNESRGRIRRLEDRDGDGLYETATIFAEGLRFPMGVTCWNKGIIVAVAPDIIYLEDTNDDGKADAKTVLYTGFNLSNIQQMVNSLQWAADGWIHGLAGNNAGTISSPQSPNTPAVTLQARGFRFRPEIPGSLEPTSGGGQYGLSADPYGHWFTATNSQHLRQIVIPDHYLRRNPSALVTAVSLDIPDHGAAAKVFRISPFEGWRVERTTRRAGSPDAKRFPTTELVPGGFITSACSPLIYTASLLPNEYRNQVFVCDPANNLIHRDHLEAPNSVFVASRIDNDCEFLASTDNWFRPVQIMLGPDGAMYVLDFYREVIETPLSLPDDIKAKLNLESRATGRIWRIAPEGYKPTKLADRTKLSNDQLAGLLLDPNSTNRLLAHRLLCERQAKDVVPKLTTLAKEAKGTESLPLVLGLLERFGGLTDEQLKAAFADPVSGNREVGLRLAEPRFERSADLRRGAAALASDPVPMVRFQLALSAGFFPPADAGPVLGALIQSNPTDPWLTSAILISAKNAVPELLAGILTSKTASTSDSLRTFVNRSANSLGAQPDEALKRRLLEMVLTAPPRPDGLDLAVIEGLAQGMRTAPGGFRTWLSKVSASGDLGERLRQRASDASKIARDEKATLSQRLNGVRWLAIAPYETAAPVLTALLAPTNAPELQLATVRALAAQTDPTVVAALLKTWGQVGPSVRREMIEQIMASPDRIGALLEAIEKDQVKRTELEPARIAQLKAHPVAAIKTKAEKLFAGQGTENRKTIVASYLNITELKADVEKGRAIFKQQCAACHKLGTDGHEVGPNLLAVVPGKSPEDLVTSLFDPNREVDPRYVNYLANTVDGKVVTGIVVAETASAVALKRSEGVEEAVRRADLESLKSTGLSLMPEGLEKNLSKQDVADLLAFIRQTVAKSAGK